VSNENERYAEDSFDAAKKGRWQEVAVEYRVLGPLEVHDGDESLPLAGQKQRALLALLLVNANRVLSRDRLIDELWGLHPPETAVQSLQVYVSRLRKLLPSNTLLTRPPGYLLELAPGELDLQRFERLLADGHEALALSDPERASNVLHEALALWRGPALAEFAFEPFAQAEIGRLEDLRVSAVEERVEADLALGRHTDLIGELEALIAENPHRERLRGQLMLALYRSGRQAEALEAYRVARGALVDELGIEPSADLQRLERQILTQEKALNLAEREQRPPTNLPVQPTSLIGRERELATVAELLGRGSVRLLTLTGPGGSGKTRLALQAGAELVADFPQGVFLVALAPIADPTLVLPTIAQTVGIRESGAAQLADRLKAFLADKRLLLVLDNMEQLLEAAPELAELLAAAPSLKLLVTSRTPLHLSGEQEFEVPPLGLPDAARPPEASVLLQYEAVALFVERARAVKADFALTSANARAVAEICVRLDGLPLAIELAAARAKTLSPQALLSRLEQRFDLLTGGPADVPARQQTLRATVDWSYHLLGPNEQTLFVHLAVFVGGCTLPAAEAVCGNKGLLTGLSTLIDSSMLRQEDEPDGEPRFTMLETIRAYALERLEAPGESDEIRRRHAEHFLAVAEQIVPDWRKGDVDLFSLERDHDNFRAALKRFVLRDDRESFVRLVFGLWVFWGHRNHLREGARWSEEAVRLASDLPLLLQARASDCASSFSWQRWDLQHAWELAQKALAAYRGAKNTDGEAWSLRQLGVIAEGRGDLDEADDLYEQAAAMFREQGELRGLQLVVHDQATCALGRCEYTRARALLEECLARARELGSDASVGNAILDLGILALHERRYDDSVPLFVESLGIALTYGRRGDVPLSLRGLAASTAVRQHLESAARVLGAAETIEEQIGEEMWPYERLAFAEAMAPVVDRAEEPAIAAAWAAGRAMSEADAVSFALATVAERAPF